MTQVSRKGFVDKNGQKVVIVPNVPGATEGNLPQFDAEGNLQDSCISAGLVGKTKFSYRLGIVKSDGAYTWGTSTTQALLEEIYNSLENGPYDALPVRVQIPGFTYAGYAAKGQAIGVKEIDLYVGTIAFQAYYNTSTNLWNAPVIVKSAVVLDALKSTEQLSSGNDYRLITSGAVKAAINEVNEKIDNALNEMLEISFTRNADGNYNLTDGEKETLNAFIQNSPQHKTMPCFVTLHYYNDGNQTVFVPGYIAWQKYGTLTYVYLSFFGNDFWAYKLESGQFTAWEKRENPFATVSAGTGWTDDSGINGDNSAADDQPSN